MKKIVILIFILIASMTMKAHQSNVSTTMLLEKENNVWFLQISASLSAFEQEIKIHFSETPYKTPEAFQQMVLNHIKNNFEITFNENQTIALGKGMLKLGHETKVVFELIDVPLNINSVLITNTTFQDIHNNKSILVLLREGFDKEDFVLNKANNHTLELMASQNKFIVKTENEASFFSYQVLFVLLFLVGLGFYLTTFIKKN